MTGQHAAESDQAAEHPAADHSVVALLRRRLDELMKR